ncbi:MAG TPA: GNAT family N-acetyltransferase [Usitatibacter sp.]|nr:GNAT family N-acetyltransferase [Usitatibacter sp.]
MSLRIAALAARDRAAWEPLARGYKAFYRTETSDAEYEAAWGRILRREAVFGLGAKEGRELVGIAHYLFHASAWAERVCYLQDLFVAPHARGKGVARALIEAVAGEARKAGAARCYWQTQQHNATARALYDKVGRFNGFIRYDYPMQGAPRVAPDLLASSGHGRAR